MGPRHKIGPRGKTGARGPQGARGLTGPTGRRGKMWAPGAKGSQGVKGPLHQDDVLDKIMTHFDDLNLQLAIQLKRIAQIQQQVDQLIAERKDGPQR